MRRIVIRSTAAGLALFICVIAYQGYSYAAALGKATEDVLNSWAKLNDVQSAEVSLYRVECISIPRQCQREQGSGAPGVEYRMCRSNRGAYPWLGD